MILLPKVYFITLSLFIFVLLIYYFKYSSSNFSNINGRFEAIRFFNTIFFFNFRAGGKKQTQPQTYEEQAHAVSNINKKISKH